MEERDLSNCVGQFSVKINQGKVFNDKKYFEELKIVMSSIIVIKATYLSTFDEIHYVAISEHFREIEDGDKVPVYLPIFSLDEKSGKNKIEWNEVKNEISS